MERNIITNITQLSDVNILQDSLNLPNWWNETLFQTLQLSYVKTILQDSLNLLNWCRLILTDENILP